MALEANDMELNTIDLAYIELEGKQENSPCVFRITFLRGFIHEHLS